MFIFIKQANDSSQHRLPRPSGHRATADAAVGMMQVVLAPERLSPSPLCTLRLVFIQEFLFSLFSLLFFLFRRDTTALFIYLFVKMMSEQRTSPQLRPHPP
jgi:hypothetical protein